MNPPGVGQVRVWDRLVRTLHWLLATGFFAAYFTRHASGAMHEWLGYGVLAVVGIRLIWGFAGTRYARFSQFIRSPAKTLSYSRKWLTSTAPRFIGHNPLGGWMTVCLLLGVLATCISGWLYTTDRYWGVEWVENLHETLTWACFGLIALHLAGVIHASWHHRENLVAAMLHGRKREPAGTDVD